MHFQVADATDDSQTWQTASPSTAADGIYITHSAAKEWLRAASLPALVTLHVPRIATAALGLPAGTAAGAPHCQLHVLVLFAASMCRSCKRLRIGMRKAAGMHSQCMNLDAANEGLSEAQAVGSSMVVSPVYSLQQAGHKGVAMLWLNEPVLDTHPASRSMPVQPTVIMTWLVGSVTMGRAIQKTLPTSISEAQHALASIATQLTSTALRTVLAEVETAQRPAHHHHHQSSHHHAAHHLTQKARVSPTLQARHAANGAMRQDTPGPKGLLAWLTFTRDWLEHFEQDIACAAHGEDLLTSVRLAMQLAARAIEAAGAMPGPASTPAAAPPPPPAASDRRRASSTQATPPKLQWPARPQAHVWGMDATQALARTARPGSARLSSSFLAQSAVAAAKANLGVSYQSPSSTISSFAGSYDASALRERTVVLDGDAVPSAAFAAAQQSLHRPRLQRARPAPPEPSTRLSASSRPGTGGAIATPALARRHQVLTMANATRHP